MPYRRYVHDFVDLEPANQARKAFRLYFYGTILIAGYLFAHYTTDRRQTINTWYNRPDLKPYPAMVAKEHMDVT